MARTSGMWLLGVTSINEMLGTQELNPPPKPLIKNSFIVVSYAVSFLAADLEGFLLANFGSLAAVATLLKVRLIVFFWAL